MTDSIRADAAVAPKVHLLDVGEEKYGDCILCQFGNVTVLIDGAHPGDEDRESDLPSIPDQLSDLLGTEQAHVDLLVVTHAHSDHIGCLPALVESGFLTADWALVADPNLGWGRNAIDAIRPAVDRVDRLRAALREESRSDDPDDERIRRFLQDAGNLESNYASMLQRLAANGTRVVRYGRDAVDELLAGFAGVGMQILGPTQEQLLRCARVIQELGRDASDAIAALDAGETADEVALYRQIAGSAVAADAGGSVGAAVNDQSIVLTFRTPAGKVLLTGDMQFASPGVTGISSSMRQLRQTIATNAPYAFVKLAHHGARNGLSEDMFEEFGAATRNYGISTGQAGRDHPNPRALELLEQRNETSPIRLARNDRNGRITVTLGANGARVRKQRGQFNDFTPKGADAPSEGPRTEITRVEPPPSEPMVRSEPSMGLPNVVEVVTRVPHTSTRVTVTIDVEPRSHPAATQPERPSVTAGPPAIVHEPPRTEEVVDASFRLAGGRSLPPLLFVTSRAGLANHIGQREADQVLAALRSPHRVFDGLPAGLTTVQQVAPRVAQELRRYPEVRGIVLVGGYDVVPAQRLDVLPPSVRQRLAGGVNQDPDDFIVWSDAVYGARGAGTQPLPVSRIPDGKSSRLVFAALGASNRALGNTKTGVRNVARPFADGVFGALAGQGQLLISAPAVHNQQPPIRLAADRLYLMLHGKAEDATRFWGERTPGGLPALTLDTLPAAAGPVVFAGCCWGALPAAVTARDAVPGQSVRPRSADSSLALRFLERGATAFIGCTGAHYSPVEPPYDHVGGPMHRAFWAHYTAGRPPAEALHLARADFLRDLPHGLTDPWGRAVEFKTLHQFTCLGLGW